MLVRMAAAAPLGLHDPAAVQPSGIASVDRVFANLDPLEKQYMRGEITLEELAMQMPDADAGVPIEDVAAWLSGSAPAK